MGTYTIIKKSGERYQVTTDDNKRTQIRSGSGYATGGEPTVYRKSTGRKDETATVQKLPEEKKVSQEINLKAEQPKTQQSQTLQPTEQQYYQTYQYIADGGVNQGTQEQNQPVNFNIQNGKPKGVYSAYEPPKWFINPEENFKASLRTAPGTLGGSIVLSGVKSFNFDRVTTEYNKLFNPAYSDPQLKTFVQIPQGFGESLIGVGKGVQSVATQPAETVNALLTPATYEKAIQEEKSIAQNEPGRFIGRRLGDLFVISSPTLYAKYGGKVYDYYKVQKGRNPLEPEFLTSQEVIEGSVRYPRSKEPSSIIQQQFYGRENSPFVKNAQLIYDEASPLYSPINQKPITNVDEAINYLDLLGKNLKDYESNRPLTISTSPQKLTGDKVLTREELKARGLPTSESEGIFGGTEAIYNYYKLGGGESYTPFKFTVLPKYKIPKPATTIIRPEDVRIFERADVTKAKQGGGISYLNRVAEEKIPEGSAFISPAYELGKKEIESLYKAGTYFQTKPAPSGEFYIDDVFGRKIPITQIETAKVPDKAFSYEDLTKQLQKENIEFSKFSSSSKELIPPYTLTPVIPSSSGGTINPPSTSTIRVTTSGNVPSGSLSSITSTTPFNPGYYDITKSADISATAKITYDIIPPSSSIPELKPIEYPIIPPSPSPSPRPRRSSGGGSPSIIQPPPSSSGGGGDSSAPIIPPSSRGGGSRSGSPPSRITFPSIYPSITSKSVSLRSSSSNINNRAFDVLVRKKGIFRKVNPYPLTKASAIDFGTYKVGSDSSATFKLKSVFGTPQVQSLKGDIRNFYRKGELFIEKKEKRIKRTSPLELKEITFKGIASKKSKPKKNKKIKNIFGRSVKWV